MEIEEWRQDRITERRRRWKPCYNSWDKNDPKDAQVLLHMLRIQATQIYHDPLRAGINDA